MHLTQTPHNIVARGLNFDALLPPCPNLRLLRMNLILDPARRTNMTSACLALSDAALPSLRALVFNVENIHHRKPHELQATVEELLDYIGVTLDSLLSDTRFPALQRIVFHIGGPPWKPDREWWLSRLPHWFPLCYKDNKVRLSCAQPNVSLLCVLFDHAAEQGLDCTLFA